MKWCFFSNKNELEPQPAHYVAKYVVSPQLCLCHPLWPPKYYDELICKQCKRYLLELIIHQHWLFELCEYKRKIQVCLHNGYNVLFLIEMGLVSCGFVFV